MKKIIWKEEFNTNVDEIDKQHRFLVNRINELIELKIMKEESANLYPILLLLVGYAQFHFEYEENFMKKNSYPKFLSHKMEHKKFIDKINAVDLSTIDENQEEALLSILEFIATWLESHILETDKRVANYLQENNG